MRKFSVFLFVFIFLPVTVKVDSNVSLTTVLNRNIKTDKPMELSKEEAIPKTVRDTIKEALSDWKTAEASFYDNNDSTQTRENCNGVGAFGRSIESGSIALGSSLTARIRKEGIIIFVQIKNCNIVTPYGKGIFRIDDAMHSKFNVDKKYYIDFFQRDLDKKHIQLGRFSIKFKLYKIVESADMLTRSADFLLFFISP